MDGEQLPAQPKPEEKKQGRTIFEAFGIPKAKSDQWWKTLKVFLIFGMIGYFCGIVIDMFLQQSIFQFAIPLMILSFLIWKFWGKDLLVKK